MRRFRFSGRLLSEFKHRSNSAAVQSPFYIINLCCGSKPAVFQESLFTSSLRSQFICTQQRLFKISSSPLWKQEFHSTGHCCEEGKDFYETLGVRRDASRDEIKKAFYSMAKKYHPDTNQNNEVAKQKFQKIRDAYNTLQDPERRAQYDKELLGDMKKGRQDDRHWRNDNYSFRDPFSGSFHKIFSEFFEGEGDTFAGPLQLELSLSFLEAAKGCKKHISFKAQVPCEICHGSGHQNDGKQKSCPTCRGFGRVAMGPFTSTCNTCYGVGHIIMDYCIACRGSGTRKSIREIDIDIPAGVDSGDTISIPETGNYGRRGVQPGNINIKLTVEKDPIYVRDGADIYVDSNISFTQAMVGGNVEVPTLLGNLQVKIPKGVQHGHLLMLRGRGLPKRIGYSDCGNQYVRFGIHFPKFLNERQKALIEEFAKEELEKESSPSNTETWWQETIDKHLAGISIIEITAILSILLLLFKFIS